MQYFRMCPVLSSFSYSKLAATSLLPGSVHHAVLLMSSTYLPLGRWTSSIMSKKPLALRGPSRWSSVFCLKGSRILEMPLIGSCRMPHSLLGILLNHPRELSQLVAFYLVFFIYLGFFFFYFSSSLSAPQAKSPNKKNSVLSHISLSLLIIMAKDKKCKQLGESWWEN